MSNYRMLDSEDNPMRLRANITPYTVLTWMAISYANSRVYEKKFKSLPFHFRTYHNCGLYSKTLFRLQYIERVFRLF